MSLPNDLPTSPAWRRYWPIILLFLLPVIPLFRAVFLGEAIGPFDQIRQMSPWNGAKPAQAWDVLQADGVLQFYVWRNLVFDAWGKGQLPFWNSYQLAGTPLLANSQSAGLYPLHILMGVLHVPTATAMTLLAWFHLFWAGFGAFSLCRALGGNKVGGFVAGASFSLSTFMLAWTGLPSVIETVSWIPWVLACTVWLFDLNPLVLRLKTLAVAPDDHPADSVMAQHLTAMRRYNGAMIGLILCIGMLILSGHLQFVAYGFISLGVLVVWLIATRRNPFKSNDISVIRESPDGSSKVLEGATKAVAAKAMSPVLGSTTRVVVAGILGLCIAAPQLLSVLQYSQFSHRKNTASEEGYSAYVSSAIQPYELAKLVVPTIQGNPREIASDKLPVSTYYPAILKPGANFAESAIGIGVFGLMLLCLLPLVTKKKDPIWGLMVVGGLSLLLALGTPVNKLFYFGIPGWSSTGSPGRAICLFVLAACVGAGVAASRLDRVGEVFKTNRRLVEGAIGGIVFIIAICTLTQNSYSLRAGLNAEIVDAIKSQAVSSAISGAVGISLLGLLAIAFAVKEQSLRSKAVLMAIPVLSCIAFFGMTIVPTGTPDLHVDNRVGLNRIAPINKAWDIFQAAKANLPPNLAALNRIHSLDGYDSLLHRDTVALLKDIDGQDAAPAANGNMMFINPKADLKKLADAGVTEIWSRDEMEGLGEGTRDSNFIKYHLAGPGRASTPAGSAQIESETFSQLKLQATGPGKLTVRERNMPGWIMKVDGTHVPTGTGTWMETELTAGQHQIVLNYVPPGFMTGLILAFVAWVIVLLLAFQMAKISRIAPNPK